MPKKGEKQHLASLLKICLQPSAAAQAAPFPLEQRLPGVERRAQSRGVEVSAWSLSEAWDFLGKKPLENMAKHGQKPGQGSWGMIW